MIFFILSSLLVGRDKEELFYIKQWLLHIHNLRFRAFSVYFSKDERTIIETERLNSVAIREIVAESHFFYSPDYLHER